ncbi:alpha/beta fold hydrolase [Lacisediminihabitans profunda]|uniref:Alpha/beta hydrolase n=1 Tax=Lacisediminihabitans profunda TaxID=2594790 RepID=A0A5C8UTK3_9MICO|nr:alpha/beta hydrolase [Lacisediminihabitans profunda]TXN30969.1 alpha/beta hydrolase [Lacisediminihabitans profunda]
MKRPSDASRRDGVPDRGTLGNGMPYLRAGAGGRLVFLPGIAGGARPATALDRRVQGGQISLLARHHEVWWIGHRPGLPPDFDMASVAGEYADTLRHLFGDPVDVIGVSTGGSIALQLAADHPDVVNRLVVVSSAYRLGPSGRLAQQRTGALLRAGRPQRAAAELMSRLGRNAVERNAMTVAGLMLGPIVVGNDDPDLLVLLDAEDGFDLHGRLPEITAPTLVLGGDSDGFYPESLFRETALRIQSARLVLYRGVGHMTTQGNHRLAADVRAFLED